MNTKLIDKLKFEFFMDKKNQPIQLRRQRWVNKVTFWTVSSKIIDLFKVDDNIKINAQNYYKYLNKTFLKETGLNQKSYKLEYIHARQ